MATQKCPRCESSRVRRGYRPTSLFKKLTFRYNLLCDSCNWQFVGFAIPGTVPSKTKKKRQTNALEDQAAEISSVLPSEVTPVTDNTIKDGKRKERSENKRIKTKISS